MVAMSKKKYVKFQSKIETNRKKFANERFDDAIKEMNLDFDNSSDSDDPLENHLPQEHYVDVLSQFSPQLEPIKTLTWLNLPSRKELI